MKTLDFRKSDVRNLLPSEARRIIIEFIFNKMNHSSIRYNGKSSYDYVKVLGDFGDDEYVNGNILLFCFKEAEKKWEKLHPWKFDSEQGIYVRIK